MIVKDVGLSYMINQTIFDLSDDQYNYWNKFRIWSLPSSNVNTLAIDNDEMIGTDNDLPYFTIPTHYSMKPI